MTTTFGVADPRHGGQLRCFHLYGAMARHLDVEIVSQVERAAEAGVRELAPGLTEVAVLRSPEHALAGHRLSRRAGLPVTDIVAGSHVHLSPRYLGRLAESLRGASAVVLAEPYLRPALEALGSSVPRVYDAFNVEADLKASALPATPLGRSLLAQVLEVERLAVTTSRAITTCSTEDADRLSVTHDRDRADFTVVPNGTDCRFAVPDPDARRAGRERWLANWAGLRSDAPVPSHLAVFFASWHPPNLAAAELLLRLAPQLPEVQFVLGGSHGDAFQEHHVPANVAFTGMIGDRSKRALLAAADVALNPMLQGSGTNLKVIEYLAAGVPVVSTQFGVRGLAAEHGRHLVVTEPGAMASAVRSVLADPVGAAERAAAGRRLAVEHYDWQALGDRLAAVVQRAVRDSSHVASGRRRSSSLLRR